MTQRSFVTPFPFELPQAPPQGCLSLFDTSPSAPTLFFAIVCSLASQAQRRRGEIEEIEQAYVAGLPCLPAGEGSMATAGSVIDWRSDNEDGNRWGATAVARKALYFSLQAGAAAHLSLKERMAAEAPWVKASARLARMRAQMERHCQRLLSAPLVLSDFQLLLLRRS